MDAEYGGAKYTSMNLGLTIRQEQAPFKGQEGSQEEDCRPLYPQGLVCDQGEAHWKIFGHCAMANSIPRLHPHSRFESTKSTSLDTDCII